MSIINLKIITWGDNTHARIQIGYSGPSLIAKALRIGSEHFNCLLTDLYLPLCWMQMGLNQLGSNQMNKLWTIRISTKSAQDCEKRLLSTAQKIGTDYCSNDRMVFPFLKKGDLGLLFNWVSWLTYEGQEFFILRVHGQVGCTKWKSWLGQSAWRGKSHDVSQFVRTVMGTAFLVLNQWRLECL